MRAVDLVAFAAQAAARHRLRSALLLAAMAIGSGAVVSLTALGETARRYVVGEFAALGTNLLVILPGRSETTGGPPPLLGETPRDLTIADAMALTRSRLVRRVAPIVVGQAAVSVGPRERETTIVGSTADLLPVRHLRLARGRFLPPGDPERAAPVCVLGGEVRRELFGSEPAVGRWLRAGEWRFRVLGVLDASGESLGLDLSDVAIVPVASAQRLFATESLFRILVQTTRREALGRAERAVRETIRARHEGEDDVTVITQDAMLATFDRVLGTLTLAVGGIAGISLVVAGVLIMNVSLVSVSQRTAEIGLLKALGARGRTIVAAILVEAMLLAACGAGLGLGLAAAAIAFARHLFPAYPIGAPWWAAAAAFGVAVATAAAFAVIPARRAARLDPVTALAGR